MAKKTKSKKSRTKRKTNKRGKAGAKSRITKKYGKPSEAHPIYIKLDSDEKLEIKRGYLSSQMSILELLKRIQKYRTLRKKEMLFKVRLKKELTKIKSDLRELIISLPKTERIEAELEKTNFNEEADVFEKLDKNVKLESELQNINRQLAEISQ